MPEKRRVLILMEEENSAYISQNIRRLWPRERSAFLTHALDEHGAFSRSDFRLCRRSIPAPLPGTRAGPPSSGIRHMLPTYVPRILG